MTADISVVATGYHSVIVNGRTLSRDGIDTGQRPGVVLRAGQTC